MPPKPSASVIVTCLNSLKTSARGKTIIYIYNFTFYPLRREYKKLGKLLLKVSMSIVQDVIIMTQDVVTDKFLDPKNDPEMF